MRTSEGLSLFRSARLIPISLNRGSALAVYPPRRSIRPNIDRPNESRSRATASRVLTCFTYRRIAATSSILVCAHLRRTQIHATLEYMYMYVYAFNTRWIKPVPKKETKANHHIERDRDVSPGFPRYSISFFFFNSLFLPFRLASERTSEQTMRGYEARTSYRSFCLTEREFSSGGRRKKEKKMNALCSINPL